MRVLASSVGDQLCDLRDSIAVPFGKGQDQAAQQRPLAVHPRQRGGDVEGRQVVGQVRGANPLGPRGRGGGALRFGLLHRRQQRNAALLVVIEANPQVHLLLAGIFMEGLD